MLESTVGSRSPVDRGMLRSSNPPSSWLIPGNSLNSTHDVRVGPMVASSLLEVRGIRGVVAGSVDRKRAGASDCAGVESSRKAGSVVLDY
jgi:hypothetical protein